MVSEKDRQFLDYLANATDAGKIRWQPTASDDQYTASLRGKYNIVLGRNRNGFSLRMTNEQDQEMLSLTDDDDVRVTRIFTAARRVALDVDSAIDEILRGEDQQEN